MSNGITIKLTNPQRARLAEIQRAIAVSNEKTLLLTQARDVMVTTILEYHDAAKGECQIASDSESLVVQFNTPDKE